MSGLRSFPRELAALHDIFAFAAETFDRLGLATDLRPSVELVLEELFTNTVKYGAGSSPVTIEMIAVGQGVEVTITERDAECFDVTAPPPVDVDRPLEEREPGKLGLHLIRRFVDRLDYRYDAAERVGRITFRKHPPGDPAAPRADERGSAPC